MKLLHCTCFVGLLLAPSMASAQAAGASSAATVVMLGYGRHHQELVDFHSFLLQHRGTAADLKASPRSVKNPNFVAGHPDLADYLQANPAFARRLKAHPKTVLRFAQRTKIR